MRVIDSNETAVTLLDGGACKTSSPKLSFENLNFGNGGVMMVYEITVVLLAAISSFCAVRSGFVSEEKKPRLMQLAFYALQMAILLSVVK
jgi:hypothetical protein